MTTKDQERKALQQIRKIVSGLGDGSYVGTAMEGVLEVAEQNIEYDAAFSLKREKELAEESVAEMKRIMKEIEEECSDLKQANDALKESINKMTEIALERENENLALNTRIEELKIELAMKKWDVTVTTKDGESKTVPNAVVTYIDNGISFINVVEESGWTTSYRISDLDTFTVE